jgi:2-iminoacetate synthase
MFSLPPFSDLQARIQDRSSEHVIRAMKAAPLDLSALAALLSPAADPFLPEMASLSGRITNQRFGRTTQLYAPLYVSNYCINRCRYCGFSADNKISRRLLSLDEAEQEALILRDRGFNHILLVSGEASSIMGVDYLVDLASRLKGKFAAVSIEVQPLSIEEYKRLFEAGITGVAIYQETYDRHIYDQVHISGQKTDYDFRLEIPARVAEAGMREVGIGALLGLSDWRAEGLAIGMHLAWLRKNYWRTAVTVSFPRLRPAEGSFKPLGKVTERDLSQLIFALRIFDPDVGLVLSTREEARYRDGMLGLGPTRYSAGSCTAPGGYSDPEQPGEQFSIGDHRSLAEVCASIRAKGYDPVRKDWDMEFQRTGSS